MTFWEDWGRCPARPRVLLRAVCSEPPSLIYQAVRAVLKGQGPLCIFILKLSPSSPAAVHKWSVWLTGILTWMDDTPGCCEALLHPVTRVWGAGRTGAAEWAGHLCGCRARLTGPGGPAVGLPCWACAEEQMEGKGLWQSGRVGTFKLEESKEQFSY